MKSTLLILLLILTASCSLKESADNGFKTQSEIKPFASAQKLGDRYGNKIILKIPLTENSVGYFDIDEILGNENLDRGGRTFLKAMWDSFKLKLFNFTLGIGLANKIKYSSYFDFPVIDKKYVKSAKVKRVFFTTEDCRVEEQYCNDPNRSTNFTFMDKFFVNISNYDPLIENLDVDEDQMDTLDAREFKAVADKSYTQRVEEIEKAISIFGEETNDEGEFTEEINLVRYTNRVPYMNLNTESVPEDAEALTFQIKDRIQRQALTKYFKNDEFKNLIVRRSITSSRDGVSIDLKKGVKPSQIFSRISEDQSPTVDNMFIFRLNSKFIEAKDYFKRDSIKHLVKGTTMIGRSLYVELFEDANKDEFLRKIDFDNNFSAMNLDIYKLDRCINSNCVDLEVEEFNLVPLLAVNPHLKLDSYISIKTLGSIDFKYNGYIEVELEIDLPL